MTDALWWQHAVVYQVYPRSFQDTNGDGVGDIPGATQRLDYLRETLGVDALWLSPFYPSPMADFGYDVADYTDVDPLFGSLDDFDRLVAEAHHRGLKVIIDWVPNHTSDQHAWFQESRASRESAKRDWYVWRDPKADGSPPNNWLSVFGGPAWTLDQRTGQYYLHSFLAQQPDLNWRNPEVRAAMFDSVRFWLERGVDGFRIDVAHNIMKDPGLRDNPPNPDAAGQMHKSMGDFDTQIHLYDRGHADVHEVYRDLRRMLDSYSAESPRVTIGEIHIYDPVEWATYYGANLDELHLPFNFGLLRAKWTAQAIRASVDTLEATLPDGAWPNYVLDNHDEPRIATRVGAEQVRNAMMLLLTLRGTPTLYYGDEIGMHDVTIPPEREQDPFGKRVPGLGLGRDPQRTPMQWDGSVNAGFCSPDVEPWLPFAEDAQVVNVAAQEQDAHSLLALTRRLLQVRHGEPALLSGDYQPVEGTPDTCFAYLRTRGDRRLLVALNFSHEEQTVRLPELGSGSIVVSTTLDREGEVDLAALRLGGDEGCLIELALSGA
ncbi:MAG: alpha-amylase family glycosyl hydrolase [Ktedonobacterales bacterium]